MNNAVATTAKPASVGSKISALRVMANRLSVDEDKMMATLKGTVFQRASNEEMLALVVVANAYDLNPFLKEIYAFPAKGGGIVPIVSVDGWNKMLIRQEQFDGIEFEMMDNEDGTPYSCTATIYVKGRARPVKITEYFDECYRKTEPWDNMPRRMLRNRTLCQASRVAFGFAGVYDADEAQTFIDVTEPPPKKVAASSLVAIADTPKDKTADEQGDVKPSGTTEAVAITPQAELEELVIKNGFTFDHFTTWAADSGNIADAKSLAGFGDIDGKVAARLLKAKTGLLKGLAQAKGTVEG